jgi:Domain of unknown function (DUF4304)
MASGVIDRVVRDFLDPPLRAAGFARKARVWNRSRTDLVDVVDVQGSRWNEPGNESFTVNLGVFKPTVYRTCWQKDPPSFVKGVDCLVRRRLSEALTDESYGRQKEQWWSIHTSTDAERVGNDVADLLVAKALPFFARIESLPAVHDVLEKDAESATPLTRIYLAVVKAELGDLPGARRMLSDVEATAPGSWRERVSAVMGELSKRFSTPL